MTEETNRFITWQRTVSENCAALHNSIPLTSVTGTLHVGGCAADMKLVCSLCKKM